MKHALSQDYDLITKPNYDGVEKEYWSNQPSVWIGDEVIFGWYFNDDNRDNKFVSSKYEVIGFEEYKVIISDELVIEKRRVRKDSDTTIILELGDTIYLETYQNEKGVFKETYQLTDLSFNYSTKEHHTDKLSKEDLKTIPLINQLKVTFHCPHIMLLQYMIKNIIVLKPSKRVEKKYFSKWRFYTHLILCSGISVDNKNRFILPTPGNLDKYILSFQQRETNPITRSQYFAEINNSIQK